MPFHVYYSDRIEDLAARLKADLKKRKQADPFVFPKIVTPNPNVAKYLRIEVFSKEPEFCAGVDYPMLRGFLVEQMTANLPDKIELLPDRAYAVAIADNLLNPRKEDEEALKPFRDYVGEIKNGILDQKQAQMLWQLSDKLAGLLDDYEIHRPEVVDNWLAGGSATDAKRPPEKGSAEAGEAVLAKRLWVKDGRFGDASEKKSMRQIFDLVKNREPAKDDAIYLFGHSTLSPLQAKIVLWLAQKHEVYFYHNNPCLEYWEDIKSDRERVRDLAKNGNLKELAEKWANEDEADNALLRNFGVAGRATVALLQNCSETVGFEMSPVDKDGEPVEEPEPRECHTLLERVQESIRRRTSNLDRGPQDASLQIVGTPGLRREVEMVYNSIIGSVWKPEGSGKRPWPECSFSDIAVLVPDMAIYRPVIESVFDARGEVPYGLIDTTASEESLYLSGFLALMELGRRGLSRKTLFAFLDNACVRKKLGVDHETILDWLDLTGSNLHSFDGFEDLDRFEDGYFGWEWGLKRMRLARVADALDDPDSGEGMPLVPEGGDAAMKLSGIVELLHRELEAAFGANRGRRRVCAVGSKDADDWAVWIERLADAFLEVPDGDPMESAIRRKTTEVLESLVSVGGEWNFEVAAAAVEHYIGGLPCRKGGYLTNGVTIAGLAPMRPVPFRQIYVLGLGEGGFPGKESGTTLDVRGGARLLGDVSAPNMNRYVFLEALMSARDRLVLSYPNLDIEKDAKLFPCGPVLELEQFVSKHLLLSPEGDGTTAGFREFEHYPLLERGEMNGGSRRADGATPVEKIVWRPDDPDAGILPSYSSVARGIAVARAKGETWSLETGSSKSKKREFTAKELAEYVKNPVRGVMKGLFGIDIAGYRDVAIAKDSPVELPSGPLTWELQNDELAEGIFLGKRFPGDEAKADEEFEKKKRKAFGMLQRMGLAPTGFLGEFAKAQAEDGLTLCRAVEIARKAHLDVCDADEWDKKHVLRATYVSGDRLFSAKVGYWTEEGDAQTVVTTGTHDSLKKGSKGDPKKNKLPEPDTPPAPPSQVIEPLIACWMHLAEEFGKKQNDDLRTIRIVNLDFRKDEHKCGDDPGAWEWKILPSECATRLEKIATSYLTHLDEEVLPKLDYRKHLDRIKKGAPGDEEDTVDFWSGKKKEFDNSLVVEKIVGELKERATDDQRKRLEEIWNWFAKDWTWLGDVDFDSGEDAEEGR